MDSEERNLHLINLIANAGESKSCSLEAITAAEKGDFAAAREKAEQAENSLLEAHAVHSQLLAIDASDKGPVPLDLLLVHAATHLSNAELLVELSKHFITILENKGE